jgi:pimeloyl-ACP methyl ester carboxylesterase
MQPVPALVSLTLVLLATGGCAHAPKPAALPARTEHHGMLHGDVHVVELGPAEGEPVVFVHGLGASGVDDFAELIPRLAEQQRVLAFDLPGFARSASPARTHTPDDYVALLDRLISRRFTSPVTLVGHSMGGALAIAYAARHPERVRRLALFDVAGVLYFRDYTRRVVDSRLRARGDLLDPLRRFAYALFRVGMKPFAHKEIHELPIGDGPAVAFAGYDFGADLRAIRAPVMLGWGAHDVAAPERTRVLLRYWLRPAKDVTYADSGHVPMRSEPAAVAQDLRAFMADAAPAPLSAPLASGLPSYHCKGQRGVRISGDYARIVLDGCKDVRIEHARAQSIEVRSSAVELADVELRDGEVGLSAVRSRVSWVGGRIESEVCIDTARSRLDLVGVHCHFERRSLRVRAASRLVASVSATEGLVGVRPLHGEYPLARNDNGAKPSAGAL